MSTATADSAAERTLQRDAEVLSDIRISDAAQLNVDPAHTAPDILEDAVAERLFTALPALPTRQLVPHTFPTHQVAAPAGDAMRLAGFALNQYPPPKTTASPGSLTLLHRSPVGEVWSAPFVTATFSEPMVPLASYDTLSRLVAPLILTPEPAGTWRWIGTHTAVFQPKERFSMATSFSVTARPKATSLNGAALAPSSSWSFATPPPTVVDNWPRLGANQVQLQPKFFIRFDQNIDPTKVLPFVELRVAGRTRAVRLRTAAEAADDETQSSRADPYSDDEGVGAGVPLIDKESRLQWLAIRAEQALPADADGQLIIKRGAPSAEGPRTTDKDQVCSFKTRGALELVLAPCAPGNPCLAGSGLALHFNNFLDENAYQPDWLTVTPAVEDLSSEVAAGQSGVLHVSGKFRANTPYTMYISDQLRDRFGQTLGKIVKYKFTVSPAAPQLQLEPTPMVVLDPALPPELWMQTINQPSISVRVFQVNPTDYPEYVKLLDKPIGPPTFGKLVGTEVIVPRGQTDELVSTRIELGKYFDAGVGHVIVYCEGNATALRGNVMAGLPAGVKPAAALNWVQGTRVGLLAYVEPEKRRFWTVNLADGAPLEGVRVSALGSSAWALSDRTGLGVLKYVKGQSDVLLAQRDRDVALLPRADVASVRYLAEPQMRWFVIESGQLYKPGETIHVKGWLRQQDQVPRADLAVPAFVKNAPLKYKLEIGTESEGVAALGLSGTTRVSDAGEFDFRVMLPKSVMPGYYGLRMHLQGDHPRVSRVDHAISIRVAEYERPEFELSLQHGPPALVAGTSTQLSVGAQYFAGGPLTVAKTVWQVNAQAAPYAPPNWGEYHFGAVPYLVTDEELVEPKTHSGRTDRTGRHRVSLDFARNKFSYTRALAVSVTVSDLNQRAQSTSARLLLHPAAVITGLKTSQDRVDPGSPIGLEVIVTDLDGKPIAGRPVEIRAEFHRPTDSPGRGELVSVCRVDSGTVPKHCDLATREVGNYRVTATVRDAEGRVSRTRLLVMAYGQGQLPNDSRDEPRAYASLDKRTYQAGDRAELLVVSPFASAEGVLTVRRPGIQELRRFSMRDSTTHLPIDVRPEYLPGVTVSIDLVGKALRQRLDGKSDASLPPLAAYVHAATQLTVSDAHRRLAVSIDPPKKIAAPGARLPIELSVVDPMGNPAAGARVTLMVIDEALLTLAEQARPNLLDTFYPGIGSDGMPQPLYRHLPRLGRQQARAAAIHGTKQSASGKLSSSHERDGVGLKPISAARRYSAMSEEPAESQLPTAMRSDFSAVAAFLPRLAADARGRVRTQIQLPDSVTRYRMMAYATQGERNFGQAEQVLTTRLPLILRPAAPQFLNRGDQFELAVLVQNPSSVEVPVQLATRAANAKIIGPTGYGFTIGAGDRQQVRFNALASDVGDSVFQVAAASTLGSDAAQVSIPVQVPSVIESFAQYGELKQGVVSQHIELPQNVHPDWGGLEVSLAGTAIGQLDAALQSLVESHFDLTDTRVSRILGICSLRKQLSRVSRGAKPTSELDTIVRRDLAALTEQLARERDDWGVHLTAAHTWATVHRAHAVLLAKAQGFAVKDELLRDVQARLGRLNPSGKVAQERWRAIAYAAFVMQKVDPKKSLARAELLLSEARELARLPLEAVGWLLPVLSASGVHERDVAECQRLIDNAFTQSAAETHATQLIETQDDNTEAAVLWALLATEPNHPLVTKLAKGLLTDRKVNGWRSSQRTAMALMSLSRFAELREPVNTAVTARGWLDGRLALEGSALGLRSQPARTLIPFAQLKTLNPSALELLLGKSGTGSLYYRVGLTYAPLEQRAVARDQGFAVLRTYEPIDEAADVKRTANGTWVIERGARVRVRTYLQTVAQRNYVALTDPLPAGLQFIDTSRGLVQPLPADNRTEVMDLNSILDPTERARGAQLERMRQVATSSWYSHHVARKDRVQAFAGELAAGTYSFEYIARALTPGTFLAPGPEVQEMHAPETFGRGDGATVIVQ
jgi:uncharacterized protein YfaS (alpha-2-macroglobulin family)